MMELEVTAQDPIGSEPSTQPEALAIDARLGYRFKDPLLLRQALTHRSFANEQGGATAAAVIGDNERLEFLGDAVLDLALSEALMKRFTQDPEGALSKKRASLVNEDTLSKIALDLQIDALIRLGKGETKTGGLQKPRILASTLEAIFGAIFLDGGYAAADGVVTRLFARLFDEIGNSTVDFRADFKTRLQERLQEKFKNVPSYRVESEAGPDHDKVFEIAVVMDDKVLAIGTGKSKKAAEQNAAKNALEQMP